MEYKQGQEVRVKEQLNTEMFVVKKVKDNGYLILDEFTLNKGGGFN